MLERPSATVKYQGTDRPRGEGQVVMRVFHDTRHVAVCRKCGAPVQWAQVARTGKWVLFNQGIPSMAETLDRETSRPCDYLRHDDVHWNTCNAD